MPAKLGTFDDLAARMSDDVRKIAVAARKMILAAHPGATEVVRLGDRAASYGFGPKKMSEAHTYIIPQTDYVNLGFYYGTALKDPDQLLEGTGAKMRHVKLRSMGDVKKARALVDAAVAERKRTLQR